MAKKMKKLMAMFLAVCVMSSSFAVTAFAADEEEIKTEQIVEGGLVTDITTTTETTTDENGNKTVTVTVEKTTNGIDSEGAKIENEQTTVTSETTTEDGVVLESSVTDEGSEKSEQIVPSDNEVTVEVFEDGKPVEDASGSDNSASIVVSGDQKEGENDSEYDQTTVTTTDRTVEVEVEDVTVSTGTPVYVDKDGNEVGRTDDGFNYYWSDIYTVDGKSIIDGEVSDAFWTTGRVSGYIVNADGTRTEIHREGVCQRVVAHDNGTPEDTSDDYEVGGLYCVDASTGIRQYLKYRKANLEDANYYNEDDIAHLRGIMTHGYTWDDDEEKGMTNLENMKAMLKEAQTNGDEATKALLKDMDIDNLTREQAATATGMAVWTYGNRYVLEDGQRVEYVTRNEKAENAQRIETLYKYLLTLREEAPEETQIINEEKFIDELDMTVGGMVDGAEANADADHTNDVYNVELKFSLVVQPDANGDDLIVKVIDDEGNVVKTARIAGEQKEGESFGYAKSTTDENGKTYYILEDLQLSENSNTSFNLKLEGSQMLKEGIYIFESQEAKNAEEFADQIVQYYKDINDLDGALNYYGGMEAMRAYFIGEYHKNPAVARSQNFIGKYKGTAEINVGMQVELSFNVDESVVTTEHIWRSEASEEAPAGNGGVFALAVHRPLENIPEEEVPLADAPQTGDEAIVFAALTLLAGMSLMAMHVSEKKRKEEV
ncbi:MAG: Cys-Gln thioester bond-forming surface protein [Oscillospiraceae bacterium]|nr:Cys-Gln thioester bond-forming surface protein [Oscillospiraceae bacterium]